MNKVIYLEPASQDEIKLYTRMGQALFAVQMLEDCLSVAITLKKEVKHPKNMTKINADEILKKHQKRTLGEAIKKSKNADLFSSEIKESLNEILPERNWLVHHSMREIIATVPDQPSYEPIRIDFYNDWFARVDKLTKQAISLQHSIELDLTKYSEEIGLDMSSFHEMTEGRYQ